MRRGKFPATDLNRPRWRFSGSQWNIFGGHNDHVKIVILRNVERGGATWTQILELYQLPKNIWKKHEKMGILRVLHSCGGPKSGTRWLGPQIQFQSFHIKVRKWDLVLKNPSCASEMGQWQVTSNTNREPKVDGKWTWWTWFLLEIVFTRSQNVINSRIIKAHGQFIWDTSVYIWMGHRRYGTWTVARSAKLEVPTISGYLEVSWNGGTPKSSIYGFSIKNQPAIREAPLLETSICIQGLRAKTLVELTAEVSSRLRRVKDVMLARQVLMNCVPSPNKSLAPPGCDGGDPWMIHKYLKLNCSWIEKAIDCKVFPYGNPYGKTLEAESLARFDRNTIIWKTTWWEQHMKNTCETISFPVFLSFNQSIDNDPWRLAVTSCSGWPVLIPCWSEDGQWRARRDMYALPGPEHGTLAERPFCCGHGCMGNCVFFCFDFLPSWVLSRQKISDWRRIRMRLHMAFGYCSLYGSPQTENGRSVSPLQYDLCKEKGGVFSRFQAGFCWALSDFAGISGPICSGFDGFFSAEWHTSRASSDGLVHWGMQQDGPVSQLPLRARLLVHWHLDWIWRQLLWWLVKIDSPNIFSNLPRNHGFLMFFAGHSRIQKPFRGVWYWDGRDGIIRDPGVGPEIFIMWNLWLGEWAYHIAFWPPKIRMWTSGRISQSLTVPEFLGCENQDNRVWTLGPTVSKLTVASEKRQAWCTSGAVIDVDDDDDTNDDRWQQDRDDSSIDDMIRLIRIMMIIDDAEETLLMILTHTMIGYDNVEGSTLKRSHRVCWICWLVLGQGTSLARFPWWKRSTREDSLESRVPAALKRTCLQTKVSLCLVFQRI